MPSEDLELPRVSHHRAKVGLSTRPERAHFYPPFGCSPYFSLNKLGVYIRNHFRRNLTGSETRGRKGKKNPRTGNLEWKGSFTSEMRNGGLKVSAHGHTTMAETPPGATLLWASSSSAGPWPLCHSCPHWPLPVLWCAQLLPASGSLDHLSPTTPPNSTFILAIPTHLSVLKGHAIKAIHSWLSKLG